MLVEEGEQWVVRTLKDELLSIQAKLIDVQNNMKKRDKYIIQLEMYIRKLETQIQ